MPQAAERISEKFSRLFADLDELKERVVRIEARDEIEREQLKDAVKKIDGIALSLHEILGRESVRSAIFGVIGATVSAVVVWIITLIRETSK